MKPIGYIDKNFKKLIKDLQLLIQQPSVSAKNEGIEECAKLVKKTLEKSGIRSEILRLGKNIAPLVYGEVKSKSNPNKTLLLYNHYDVQPAEPFDLWEYPPFSGKVNGNKIFGRGSSDDKGELITRIKSVEAFLRTTGDVPCNIKFVIEGEEETGSEHIEKYLKKYRKKFSCDGVIWEFGYIDSKDTPVVGLGMKGLLYVDLFAQESNKDAHSSMAVLIKNPAWRLIQAIATLRDNNGKVLIKDWYKEVRLLTKFETRLVKSEPFDEKSFQREYGIKDFVGGKKGFTAKKALVAEPTCNVAGFVSGYTGDGAKTVLPGKALAKIDFRLVPEMDPKKQVSRLKNHLKSNGFSDLKIKVYQGEAAARTDPKDPFVSIVKDSADQVFGKSTLNVSNAGTGPMYLFKTILKSPCISIGSTHIFSRIHSPNEFARLDLLKKTTKCMCKIIEKFGMS
ncbi:MAG: M20/M25/M40 family metallo-hydrolase [Nitrosopumilaceae archaeon]|nr:M20/M25/M40 family metallo-hydrolase [Nitrosopumilaceae archaeon]NIU01793.1 M20/M25/M40 family metallo-hydrolase [Nitrosopumilaceae archaeon]NIU88193.1 M20/M25/M40 family metallo-hydrolase [Nitrosopumilaceae archaeon]NIV66516.1 M20/M25/M40 family metallo-hydrolase [Nitrosopumilaceae archaeon]NIX62395.1 M20/M25/M40 family metallo-hydrolase [Nitrosopumilaceae archaeon]